MTKQEHNAAKRQTTGPDNSLPSSGLKPNGVDNGIKRRSPRIAKQVPFKDDTLSSSFQSRVPSSSREQDAEHSKTKSPRRLLALKNSFIVYRSYWVLAFSIMAMTLFVNFPQDSTVQSDGVSRGAWPKEITSDYCTVAYQGRPLVQYVIMMDAGSMGSRIHTYKFNYCNATPELESDTFGHVEPGLSSFDGDSEGAAKSLDNLLDLALKTVPKYLHSSTPIALKATAGLRLLGEEKSNRILEAVRNRLVTKYPFPIIKDQGVAVMDGADEGVYAWVTVNYLLDRFNSIKKKATVAIMDLGGASTQVVFEPKVEDGHTLAPGEHRYLMNFNGNQYTLYQHSHLGYGLMMARSQINNYVVENPIGDWHGIALGPNEYAHPCIPVGLRQEFTSENGKNVVLVGVSDPGDQCRTVVWAIFDKQRACRLEPCSFNGVYQPTLHTAIEDDIYAFSFFFDLTAPFRLGSETLHQEITLEELEHLTERVCIGDENGFQDFHGSAEAMKQIRKSSDLCMDLSYIYGLLEYGYDVPKERKIKLAKKIHGYETGWCVGASFAVLEERNWFNAP